MKFYAFNINHSKYKGYDVKQNTKPPIAKSIKKLMKILMKNLTKN